MFTSCVSRVSLPVLLKLSHSCSFSKRSPSACSFLINDLGMLPSLVDALSSLSFESASASLFRASDLGTLSMTQVPVPFYSVSCIVLIAHRVHRFVTATFGRIVITHVVVFFVFDFLVFWI